MSIDIAAVVNLHDEGPSASSSLISAWRAVEAANSRGLSAQLVLVLDRPDEPTRAVGEEWTRRGALAIWCNEGDLGAARNAAANSTDAQWLAFLDADDLWSENWLSCAAEATKDLPPQQGPVVLHPAVNIIFGDHHSLLHHQDSDDATFSWARFRLHNAWTALSFVRRLDLIDLPFPRNELADGFGFEDWSWNMAVLDHRGRHHVVPDTCHFIRRVNDDSLLSRSQNALRALYPSDDPSALENRAPRPVVTELSVLTTQDPDLPPTHQLAPHALSSVVLEQVRLATTIEPAIAKTMTHTGHPEVIPQNFNSHVTPAHRALESIDMILDQNPALPTAEALDASDELANLGSADQRAIVAEVLRVTRRTERSEGTSMLIEETLETYPQLNRTLRLRG